MRLKAAPTVAIAACAFLTCALVWELLQLRFTLALACVLGCSLILLAFALPVSVVITCFAGLLPIWSVGSLPPSAFDALRLALAAAIFIRARPTRAASRVNVHWLIPLIVVGACMAAFGAIKGDQGAVKIGYHMLIAAPVAWSVIRRTRNAEWIWRGYLGGAVLSALVILGAAAGYNSISPQSDPGYSRLTGLAPAAPLVSYELAWAFCIAAVGAISKGARWRLIRGIVALTCLTALLISGGRGGLAGLLLVALVAVRWGWIRPGIAVGASVGIGTIIWGATRFGVALNTLNRLESPSSIAGHTDFTSGRLALVNEALSQFASSPIFGSNLDTFFSNYGAAPHSAVLNFALGGGIVPGLLVAALLCRMLWRLAGQPPSQTADGRTAYSVLAIQVAMILIEPNGPLVGLEGLTLLLLSAALSSSNSSVATVARPRRLLTKASG